MTVEEIAQWVIDNRYHKAESEKVADFEMFHHLVSSIKSYGMGECNEAIEECYSERISIGDGEYVPVERILKLKKP